MVLAGLAREFVTSQLVATRAGLAGVRTSLTGFVDTSTIDQTASVLQQEEARLMRVARGIDLVDQALRDVRFVKKL